MITRIFFGLIAFACLGLGGFYFTAAGADGSVVHEIAGLQFFIICTIIIVVDQLVAAAKKADKLRAEQHEELRKDFYDLKKYMKRTADALQGAVVE